MCFRKSVKVSACCKRYRVLESQFLQSLNSNIFLFLCEGIFQLGGDGEGGGGGAVRRCVYGGGAVWSAVCVWRGTFTLLEH